ncbi:hypothetical protein D9615_004874 [Tricholomella constricta]|uniref:tRNA (uracil-O(2)-)-methyltransferase n=1 Tax=Tricholomella constricta TaxID=117010 RepID=A0A8H5M727_9AGAR|nr:hypothetical protein D9615_004874 [Tricholomella constricta]
MTSEFPASIPRLQARQVVRVTHRKLLARRPGRDNSLEQYCSLHGLQDDHDDSAGASSPDTLILTPIVHDGCSLPYYHPQVAHLAFRYIQFEPPTLRIEVVPLTGTPTDPDARLYRTCLALLDTLDRYGWGALTNYKKRVIHDRFVPRELYQDLYLIMRERHKHLVDTWQEGLSVTQDIGIATYLMLLWKYSYSATESKDAPIPDPDQPWMSWPRPPGGFLDFGCGNGLLTHILVQERYEGRGIDLRARTSWSHYPQSTQAHLHVHAFDPTASSPDPYFQPGLFIIGNHADELTPWVPVLSTLHAASGYLSIPCCAWSFDAKYERSSTPMFPVPGPVAEFADTLNLGGEGGNVSSYSRYRIWLAALSLYCGWEVECETLRIPSTRNWAIVGRRRAKETSLEEALTNVRIILKNVAERGIFKARKPEGKESAH